MRKIVTLLQREEDADNDRSRSSSSFFSVDERTLVALVLMSRLSEDEDYLRLWQEHGQRFFLFCTQWIKDSEEDGDDDDVLLLSLHWVALWTQRLVNVVRYHKNYLNRDGTNYEIMFECIRKTFWEKLPSIKITSGLRTLRTYTEMIECLLSLEDTLPAKVDKNMNLNNQLNSLWLQIERYDDSHKTAVEREECKDAAQSPRYMMNETLQKLLTSSDDDNTLQKRFRASIRDLFLQQGKKYMVIHDTALIPSFWTSILEKWWSKRSTERASSLETRQRKDWTIVLLELFIEACEKRQSTEYYDWRAFWSVGSRWECWTRLITSSLAVDDALLRSLAWTSVAHLIETTSWENILVLDSTSGWSVSIVRVAVGEAKIQLGWIVSSDETLSDDRQILIRATCRVLVQCVDLVRELTDSEPHDSDKESSPVLTIASIQSLHRSLEEALDMAVQYLNLTDRRVPSVDLSVIQVFGSLLTEFDVFVRPHHSRQYELTGEDTDSGDQEVNTTLLALSAAVEICPPTSRRQLLLGLVAVLASAEGDKRRVRSLLRNRVLESPTIGLLKACWEEHDNVDSGVLDAASDTVALLLDVNPITPVTEVQSAILQWIRRECTRTTFNRTALDLSLACYVRLQGETPPAESDAAIIRHAYEILDTRGFGCR